MEVLEKEIFIFATYVPINCQSHFKMNKCWWKQTLNNLKGRVVWYLRNKAYVEFLKINVV